MGATHGQGYRFLSPAGTRRVSDCSCPRPTNDGEPDLAIAGKAVFRLVVFRFSTRALKEESGSKPALVQID